ncbi:MAG: hypothetical protein GY765_03715, partial [bacterium]|nr:hypothetical protein [bacterium]
MTKKLEKKTIQPGDNTGESMVSIALEGTESGPITGDGVTAGTGDEPVEEPQPGDEPQVEEKRKKPISTFNKRLHMFRSFISKSQSNPVIQGAMLPRGYPVEEYTGALDLV